jgi:lipopolysaccharide transport system permease protein
MTAAQLAHFTRQDLVDRYAGSALGAIWTLIFPLVNICVFIFVFSAIMRARLPGEYGAFAYSTYLIAGLTGWMAFANTVSRATQSFVDKATIIARVPMALPELPLHVVISEAVIYAVSLVIFGVFLAVIGYEFTPLLWLIPLVFSLQQTAAYALGFILGVLNVFLRDVQQAVAVILQLWFWFTPIVYVDTIIPDSLRWALLLNPIYPIIDAYHEIVVYQRLPEPGPIIGFGAGTLCLLVLGRWLFARVERDMRDCL